MLNESGTTKETALPQITKLVADYRATPRCELNALNEQETRPYAEPALRENQRIVLQYEPV